MSRAVDRFKRSVARPSTGQGQPPRTTATFDALGPQARVITVEPATIETPSAYTTRITRFSIARGARR